MAKKPVLLCIMDGFGWVPNETYGNAVVAAKTPHLDTLMAKYPMTTIEASGMAGEKLQRLTGINIILTQKENYKAIRLFMWENIIITLVKMEY